MIEDQHGCGNDDDCCDAEIEGFGKGSESEYIDSDDLGDYDSDVQYDVEFSTRKRSIGTMYNPNCILPIWELVT
ncbi:hypothetical protein PVK06_012141 [Gossypium arboreum]|uniref:Uncharacterized protein n=1 Tax=Gossypium arboreum TaxID=29729 RepID=A0ABR0QAY2_GOSAR|nr:hypothetical protein PVK06_012141 [Gossypium arboreum]